MKALCVGSLNLDHSYRVDRLLHPGETASVLSYERNAGGKGLNQAIALARAGAAAAMGGCVGPDGEILLRQLQADKVDTSRVRQVPAATGHAIIQVDSSGENCILVCQGANHCLTEEQIDRTLSDFSAGDILLLQNETNLLPSLLQAGKAHGLEVFLNPSPVTPALLAAPLELADWLILNEVELAGITGADTMETGLAYLAQRYPDTQVVLTLGKDGAVWQSGRQLCRQAAYPVHAVDSTAAGDTFTGYFIETYMRTRSPLAAMARAAQAAAIAVTRPGAAASIPYSEELGGPGSGSARKELFL